MGIDDVSRVLARPIEHGHRENSSHQGAGKERYGHNGQRLHGGGVML